MSAEVVGKVKSPNNHKTYDVKWNSYSKETYVSYAGSTYIGKAKDVQQAINFALSWLMQNT